MARISQLPAISYDPGNSVSQANAKGRPFLSFYDHQAAIFVHNGSPSRFGGVTCPALTVESFKLRKSVGLFRRA
jgi:hypothetical protein